MTAPFLNTFQRWAMDYAPAHGFTVTPRGNWIELHRDGQAIECMTFDGVFALCPPRSELTPAGEQYVLPGCELNASPALEQLSLF